MRALLSSSLLLCFAFPAMANPPSPATNLTDITTRVLTIAQSWPEDLVELQPILIDNPAFNWWKRPPPPLPQILQPGPDAALNGVLRAAQDDGTGLPLPSGPMLDCLRLERPALQALRGPTTATGLENADGLISLLSRLLVDTAPHHATVAQACLVSMGVTSGTPDTILTEVAATLAPNFTTLISATDADLVSRKLLLLTKPQAIFAEGWKHRNDTTVGRFEVYSTLTFIDAHTRRLSFQFVSWVEVPQS